MEIKEGDIFTIEHDGFCGSVVGFYTTREGKEGVNLQQIGTRVVHVYGRKWLKANEGNINDGAMLSEPPTSGLIRSDLSEPYEENGEWCVDEQLYPESRGYMVHKFDTVEDAHEFVKDTPE